MTRREADYQTCVVECGGGCCRRQHYVLLSATEVMRLLSLGPVRIDFDPWALWRLDFSSNGGACPFQTGAACSIHDARPEGCRGYPRQPEEGCLAWPKEATCDATRPRT